ncbi:MAG: ABC transporter ATP-binding protein [Candidatus Thermoplasmatota archaeon]|nr:ABC transporter ATP-binding protein [Candidatus Thermoplasmatota archaeon]
MSEDEERKAVLEFNIRYLIKRFYKEYLRPNLKVYLPIQVGHVITAILALIPPLILRSIIDDAVFDKDIGAIINLSLIALGVFGAIAIGRALRSYYGHKIAQKIVYDMRNDLYGHFQDLPMKFHDEKKTGELIARLVDDLNSLQEFLHHGPEGLFTATTRILGTLIILFALNIPLTLVVLAFTPLLIIYGWYLMRKMHQAFREVRSKKADMTDRLEDNLAGVKIIKAFSNELFERGRFAEENTEHFEARRIAVKYISMLGPGAYFLNSLGLVLTLGYGGYLVMEGALTPGTLAAFYTYLVGFRGPMLRLIRINEGLSRFLASVERFFDHKDIDSDIYSSPEALTSDDIVSEVSEGENEVEFKRKRDKGLGKESSILKGEERLELIQELEDVDKEKIEKERAEKKATIPGRVTFENVHFSYDEEECVLKNVDFDVPPKRSVALVGPSGSGKTTIVRLIPRLYDVDKGSVKIDGVDVKDWDLKELRNSIAMVLQDDYLFSGTIKENISYGRPEASEEEVLEMAKKANVHQFAEKMPNGYETDVGQRGIKLSGGQRQRISIARALLKDPEILILDEATSSVDSYTEKLIQEAIDRVSEGRTTFTIAHRLSTIVDADEILFIEDGRIKERGTFDELMDKGEKFSHFYDLQFGEQMKE